MKKSACFIAIGTAVVALAACSSARPPFLGPTPAGATSPILRADLNGDKTVSCPEWQQFQSATYQQHDIDRNGTLSEVEYDGLVQTTGLYENVPLGNIDTNFDRNFTLQEIDTFSRQAFSRRDRNADCVLAGNELAVAKAPRPSFSSGGSSGGGGAIGGSFTN